MPDYEQELRVRDLPEPGGRAARRHPRAGPARRGRGPRPGLGAGPPATRRSTSTPGRCCRSSARAPARSRSRPTWPACRCGRRSCSPRPRPRSTWSPGAGSSSASAPARSGTRSWPPADPAVRRARRSARSTEAIELVKAFWAGGTLRFEGEHYRAVGLHAGPRPAHDIPIWLGAYKPRMLRLTGRLADGWVPSMGYADPADLPAMSAVVDEAAVAAGRSPASVMRIYNVFGQFGTGSDFLRGRPRDWAEQLAGLTLDVGTSTLRARHRRPRRRPPVRHRGRPGRTRAGRRRARPPGPRRGGRARAGRGRPGGAAGPGGARP